MRNKIFRTKKIVLTAVVILISVFGLVVANTVTKPMDVELRTHIQI